MPGLLDSSPLALLSVSMIESFGAGEGKAEAVTRVHLWAKWHSTPQRISSSHPVAAAMLWSW